MHRGAVRSVGLHLFQELSTLGRQLAQTLLFCQDRGGVLPTFPAPRLRQPFGGSRYLHPPCIRHLSSAHRRA
jgi:hypothetical protein